MMTTLAQNANQSTSDRRSRAMGSYVTPTLVIIAVLLAAAPGSAQTFTTLYTFPGGTDSSRPNAVIRTASGVLVGTAWAGGAYGFGTVFRVNPNGKETVVYSFPGFPGLSVPPGGLIADKAGNYYGVANGGPYNTGSVYRVDASGNVTVLSTFGPFNDSPIFPKGSLVRDDTGNLYGASLEGGSAGVGTVFKLDPLGNLSILHSFGAGLAPDGQYPCVGVIRVGGILYGTTNEGGAYNNGAVYRVDTAGNEKLIDSFALDPSQGLGPCAMLDHDAAGNLFGTTSQGGTYQWGTIFKIAPNGKATILYNFTGGAADGGLPYAALTHDAAGNFYSIAQVGGAYGYGTVFKLDPAGNFTVLHAFTGGADGGFGLGDAGSHDSVILDAAGNLYGTAPLGGSAFGSSGNGVVFKITP